MQFIHAITAVGTWQPELMKAAGIGWVRTGFAYPFAGPEGETLSEAYLRDREHAQRWAAAGFKLIGGTPGLGVGTYETDTSGNLRMVFHSDLPEWMGEPGSETHNRQYARGCAFLARDVGAIAPAWQVANEIDWEQFAGPLSLAQAAELVLQSVAAMRAVNPALLVSTNASGSPATNAFVRLLFGDPARRPAYCGIDQYYGSWQDGGPDSWAERIDELHDLSGGAPIFVNEWGYASAGEVMTPGERQQGRPNCQLKKWVYAWGGGHTPEIQAEFIRQAMDVFRQRRAKLLGQSFFRWEDTATCWQCGQPDCPVETAWGLVNVDGSPKPSYAAFKDGVAALGTGD